VYSIDNLFLHGLYCLIDLLLTCLCNLAFDNPGQKLIFSIKLSFGFLTYYSCMNKKQSPINPKKRHCTTFKGISGLLVGHTGPKCGPPSMGQVQWRTATNLLHTYQIVVVVVALEIRSGHFFCYFNHFLTWIKSSFFWLHLKRY